MDENTTTSTMTRRSDMIITDPTVFSIPEKTWGFIAPFRLFISGSSSCGKSTFIEKLLYHHNFLIDTRFDYVFYAAPKHALGQAREGYIERLRQIYPSIDIIEGLPDVYDISLLPGHKLVILDDLYQEIIDHESFRDLMTTHSHHGQISVILTSQNFFMQGKYSKSIMRNYTDMVIFDCKAERQIASYISRQIFPASKNFLPHVMDWLRHNIESPFARYCWIECNPQNRDLPEILRIRTKIFPDKDGSVTPIVFTP